MKKYTVTRTLHKEGTSNTIEENYDAFTATELRSHHPRAFERAYRRWRSTCFDHYWWASLFEHFAHVGRTLGFRFEEDSPTSLQFTLNIPKSVAFDGTYVYEPTSYALISVQYPNDPLLLHIASGLRRLSQNHTCGVRMTIRSRPASRNLDQHEVSVYDEEDIDAGEELTQKATKLVQ